MTNAGEPVTAAVPVRVRDRFNPRPGLKRMRESAMPIVQLTVAATASTGFAHYVLGHPAPLLAGTVVVSSLGLARDARPRNVLDTLIGMLVGVLIAEGALAAFGQGVWQTALTVLVVLFVGRFLVPRSAFATVAAVQSIIVMVLPTTVSSPMSRLLDALVAGVTALLVTVLIPRTLSRETARDARAVFAAIDDATATVAQGLRSGNRVRGERGLEKARAIDPLGDVWRGQLESAAAVARISPWLARRRAEVERHRRIQQAMDLTVRNLRVVARRSAYASGDGRARPEMAELVTTARRAIALIGQSLDDISIEPAAREAVASLARSLDPLAVFPEGPLADQNLVSTMRPLAVDLFVATGLSGDDARAALPPLL